MATQFYNGLHSLCGSQYLYGLHLQSGYARRVWFTFFHWLRKSFMVYIILMAHVYDMGSNFSMVTQQILRVTSSAWLRNFSMVCIIHISFMGFKHTITHIDSMVFKIDLIHIFLLGFKG